MNAGSKAYFTRDVCTLNLDFALQTRAWMYVKVMLEELVS